MCGRGVEVCVWGGGGVGEISTSRTQGGRRI